MKAVLDLQQEQPERNPLMRASSFSQQTAQGLAGLAGLTATES
jgi:hypothetical protein